MTQHPQKPDPDGKRPAANRGEEQARAEALRLESVRLEQQSADLEICSDEELLSAYLDNELTGEALTRAQRLLDASADSRQLLEDLRRMQAGLRDVPRQQLDTDFAARVLRAAEREVLTGPLAKVDEPSDETPSIAGRGDQGALLAGSIHEALTATGQSSAADDSAEHPGGSTPLTLPDDNAGEFSFRQRWRRPLLYAGLAAADSVVVLVFSPDGSHQENQVSQRAPEEQRLAAPGQPLDGQALNEEGLEAQESTVDHLNDRGAALSESVGKAADKPRAEGHFDKATAGRARHLNRAKQGEGLQGEERAIVNQSLAESTRGMREAAGSGESNAAVDHINVNDFSDESIAGLADPQALAERDESRTRFWVDQARLWYFYENGDVSDDAMGSMAGGMLGGGAGGMPGAGGGLQGEPRGGQSADSVALDERNTDDKTELGSSGSQPNADLPVLLGMDTYSAGQAFARQQGQVHGDVLVIHCQVTPEALQSSELVELFERENISVTTETVSFENGYQAEGSSLAVSQSGAAHLHAPEEVAADKTPSAGASEETEDGITPSTTLMRRSFNSQKGGRLAKDETPPAPAAAPVTATDAQETKDSGGLRRERPNRRLAAGAAPMMKGNSSGNGRKAGEEKPGDMPAKPTQEQTEFSVHARADRENTEVGPAEAIYLVATEQQISGVLRAMQERPDLFGNTVAQTTVIESPVAPPDMAQRYGRLDDLISKPEPAFDQDNDRDGDTQRHDMPPPGEQPSRDMSLGSAAAVKEELEQALPNEVSPDEALPEPAAPPPAPSTRATANAPTALKSAMKGSTSNSLQEKALQGETAARALRMQFRTAIPEREEMLDESTAIAPGQAPGEQAPAKESGGRMFAGRGPRSAVQPFDVSAPQAVDLDTMAAKKDNLSDDKAMEQMGAGGATDGRLALQQRKRRPGSGVLRSPEPVQLREAIVILHVVQPVAIAGPEPAAAAAEQPALPAAPAAEATSAPAGEQ